MAQNQLTILKTSEEENSLSKRTVKMSISHSHQDLQEELGQPLYFINTTWSPRQCNSKITWSTLTPLHVATPTVQRELRKYEITFSIQGLYPTSVPRIKPWLHFVWPHQQFKESYLKYEITSTYGRLLPYLCTKNETMAPLHVTTLTVQREHLGYTSVPSMTLLHVATDMHS